MKTLIVCVSVSNGSTRKVGERLAGGLDGEIVEPEQVAPEALDAFDLVGFGSGIYFNSPHARLRDLVKRLPQREAQPAFVFFTSGAPEPPLLGYTRPLRSSLERKGFRVLDTFSCRGLDTVGPLRFIGGINKGHPNEGDLRRADEFARALRARCGAA